VWQRDPKIERLKAVEREELDAAAEEWARRELRPHGFPEWFGAQLKLWTLRFERLARWAKAVVTIAAVGPILLSGYKLTRLMWVRFIARPEMPATGQPTTATDFVERPLPDAGPSKPEPKS
jgi:hypothetical protein